MENQDDEDIDEIGYAVSKDTVVRAWKRFRPVNFEENEERNSQIIKNKIQEREISEIFGEVFILEILKSVKLKIYNYTDSEQQNKRKATFKNHVT